MKKNISILSCIWLLNACSYRTDFLSQPANSVAKCPTPTTVFVQLPTAEESVYEPFDYHIRSILVDANIIKFQTLKYDFVFCQNNSNWTVQPGTLTKLDSQKNYIQIAEELINPTYKTINFQGKEYQYRVVIEPSFFMGEGGTITRPNVEPKDDKIVFELIIPNNKAPQRQVLYTLQDLQQVAQEKGYIANGVQLGAPNISASVIHDNRLYWSIAFEQGEGNTGLGTIVSYEPQVDRFTVIQPRQLWSQQITDLAVTGDANNPTFWLGTKFSGEGNPDIPAMGLVAYRPDLKNLNSGSLTSYNLHNSPIVGAIPDKLRLEGDKLWVGTGNGVCSLKWQAANNPQSWTCWRFALMAKLPSETVPLYSKLSNQTPATKLAGDVEVLWWSPLDYQTRKGRYEVRNSQGFTVKLEQGARIDNSKRFLPIGKPPIYWAGFEWHWNGDRFIRGFDQVARNEFGGGPQGIGVINNDPKRPDNWNAIRGDLELLQLDANSTNVKYYSGWVNDNLINPYLTVLPQERPQNPQPNPLVAIANQLQP